MGWLNNLQPMQKIKGYALNNVYLSRGSAYPTEYIQLNLETFEMILDRLIQPTAVMGFLDDSTGRIRVVGDDLGDVLRALNDSGYTNNFDINNAEVVKTYLNVVDDTTDTAKAWTVPTSKFWVILDSSVANGNRAAQQELEINDGSSGHFYTGDAASGAERFSSALRGHRIQFAKAGWTVTSTDVSFVGGDANVHCLTYLEFSV